MVGLVVVVEVEVVLVEVVKTLFLEQIALHSKPALVFFLSVFHSIFADDWNMRGLFAEGLLDPQYLTALIRRYHMQQAELSCAMLKNNFFSLLFLRFG